MAYKYGSIPSERSQKEDTADFWEIEALREFGIPISEIDILKTIAKEFDELDNDGIESQEDRYGDKLGDVFRHLNDRSKFSGSNYPFVLSKTSIRINRVDSVSDYLYVFFLLATRFNMQSDKVQDSIDGTLLFEFICSHAIKRYLGTNSKSFVFGTGETGGFKQKIDQLVSELGEGQAFKNANSNPPTKNDDGIDIVAWKEFADKRGGKLIGFGQCKTGTSWKDKIHKLKPGDFCTNWLVENPIFEPIPIIFLCDTLYEDLNFVTTQKGFLIFNRFRLMEYATIGLPDHMIGEVKRWVDAALGKIQN